MAPTVRFEAGCFAPVGRGRICAVMAASLLLSVLVLLLTHRMDTFAVVCSGALFLALPLFLLMGDTYRRSIYCLFLFQFTASFFIQLSFYATIICLLFFPLMLRASPRRPDGGVWLPGVRPLVVMLLGWAVSLIYLSLSNSGDFRYKLLFDIFFLLGLITIYGVYYLIKVKTLDVEKLVACIAFSGLLIVALILALYVRKGDIGVIFSRRFGTYTAVNPNILASYLDLTLPCAFFTAFFEKRNHAKKMLYYGLSAVYVVVILMAASRGSLPAIAVIAAYVIWRKRSWKLFLTALICTGVAVTTIAASAVERLLSPTMSDIMSNMGRVELLRSALKIIKENHYFFGIGMNNFTWLKFGYGFPLWIDEGQWMSSHNFFAEIWLGWGALGLIGWLALNVALVSSLLRKAKDCAAANAIAFALVAFFLHGFFDSMLANYSIMFTYFALMGGGIFIIGQTKGINNAEKCGDIYQKKITRGG